MARSSQLLPCQIADPQRGPFDPAEHDFRIMREGKTREDRLSASKRPRVAAAQLEHVMRKKLAR